MFQADSALTHTFVRNAHCPDPRCAARLRPFAGEEARLPRTVVTNLFRLRAGACCPEPEVEPIPCC